MTQAKHTATPWYIATSNEVLHIQSSQVNEDNYICGIPQEELNAEANAEFIVKAVNSHEALVEACQASLEVLKGDCVESKDFTIKLIKQALKQAEGT